MDSGYLMLLKKIDYEQLNSRQQENHNFHMIAASLATYGFNCIRLSDDWKGADFIAQHIDGKIFLKVQLKGRLSIEKDYIGKELHICFQYPSNSNKWYLYPHDKVKDYLLETTNIGNTSSWRNKGEYTYRTISITLLKYLSQFKLNKSPGYN